MVSHMDPEFDRAVSEAISHIGISTYSSGKIRQFLIKKGYDEGLASSVVSSLTERGYIDDRKAAGQVLLFRNGKKRESREFSYKRLIEAGISSDTASEVCEDLPDDIDAAYELFESSLVDDCDINAEQFIRKAFTLASRRGFSFESAQNALRKWIDNRQN